MKVLRNFNFISQKIEDHLFIESQNNEIINYQSVLLMNPHTVAVFPDFDKLFYERMDTALRHILYQYEHGWIKSERQIFLTGNECLTTIQLIYRKDRVQMNVFQRSSNTNNLKEDIEFLNWFLEKNFENQEVELNVFVSMPHRFTTKITKVD